MRDYWMQELQGRGVAGDRLLDAMDLLDDLVAKKAEIGDDATVTLYHATKPEHARKIVEEGQMYGREDGLFFSTKSDGQIVGYGESVIETNLPVEDLCLNDEFIDELHLTVSLPIGKKKQVQARIYTR